MLIIQYINVFDNFHRNNSNLHKVKYIFNKNYYGYKPF